jgi:hypothetical protein
MFATLTDAVHIKQWRHARIKKSCWEIWTVWTLKQVVTCMKCLHMHPCEWACTSQPAVCTCELPYIKAVWASIKLRSGSGSFSSPSSLPPTLTKNAQLIDTLNTHRLQGTCDLLHNVPFSSYHQDHTTIPCNKPTGTLLSTRLTGEQKCT